MLKPIGSHRPRKVIKPCIWWVSHCDYFGVLYALKKDVKLEPNKFQRIYVSKLGKKAYAAYDMDYNLFRVTSLARKPVRRGKIRNRSLLRTNPGFELMTDSLGNLKKKTRRKKQRFFY